MKIRGKMPPAPATPHHDDEVKPGFSQLTDERIAKAIDAYRGEEYVAEDLLDLIDNSLRLVNKSFAVFLPFAEKYALDSEQAAMRLNEGFHLLDAERLEVGETELIALAREVLALASFTDEETFKAMTDWVEQAIAEPARLADLLRLSVARDAETINKLATQSGLLRESFFFLLHNLGSAVLPAFAHALAHHVDDEQWMFGACPICGNQPAMGALVGDGGKRHLYCGACNFVWTFSRLKCPYCGNEDSEQLRALTHDDEAPHYLDACLACERYVKTVDYRKADAKRAVLLPVEDAATVFLDIMAVNEGYRRE